MDKILEELKQIKQLLKISSKDRLLTRNDLMEEYGLTKDETDKVFCSKVIPVVRMGKCYKVSQKIFEESMQKGVIWMWKRKVIIRIIQILIIIITILVTKWAIHYTTTRRGYEAIGGEYTIPIFGLLGVLIVEDIYQEYEKRRKLKYGRGKKKKSKKRELSIQSRNQNR